MKRATFNDIVEETLATSEDVLVQKGAEYADKDVTDDRLHGFVVSASLLGTSSKEALAGAMVKHTVSVYDMIASGNDFPLEKWDEKITDHINYLILLRACVIEEIQQKGTNA